MFLESGVGISTQSELVAAVQEAAQTARTTCSSPSAVLFFCTFNYPPDTLTAASQALSEAFPGAGVAGGTVNGLTFGESRYDAVYANDHAVAVVVLGGASLSVGFALEPDPKADPVGAGKRLINSIRSTLGKSPEGALIFTPGFATGMPLVDQKLLDGIRSVEPRLRLSGTGFSGGIAYEGQVEPGYAVLGDRVERLGTLLVAFHGGIRCGFSVANGMEAIGPGAFVTDAEGPVIRTLNGQPAREVVADLLSQGDEEAREHILKAPIIACVERGIAVGISDPEGDFFWAHGPQFFLPDGSMVDLFEAKRGSALSLVKIDPKTCMSAIKQAADMIGDDAGTSDFNLVMAFSCALRGFTLGPQIAHEDLELKRHIKTKHQLGIVANGEIGSYRHGRPFSTAWVYALFGLADGGR